MTDEIRDKLDEKLKKQFSKALKVMRDNQTDVIGINDMFLKKNRNDYNKFIEEIGEAENFLNYVNFKINFVLKSD